MSQMVETLINSSSDVGGDAIRYLRSKIREITEVWAERAANMPPHRLIGSQETINEIGAGVPLYLSVVLEAAEMGDCGRCGQALRPLGERMSAAGVPVLNLQRALALAREVVSDFLRPLFQQDFQALAETLHVVNSHLDEAQSVLTQLCVSATMHKLQEAEDKYLNFMKNASEALFVCEPQDGTILEANRRAEEISGLKTGSLVGMRLVDFEMRQAGISTLLDGCKRALAERQTVVLENVQLVRKDGSFITADARISSLLGEPGQAPSVLVSIHDTTPEKELEQRMQSFSEQLNRTANEKTEEIAALTRVTSAISSGVDMEKIFQVVVFEIGKLVAFDRLSILLQENDGQHYRVMASAGNGAAHLVPGAVFPLKGSLVERAFDEHKPVTKEDISGAAEFAEEKLLPAEGMVSYVCAPLITAQKLVGALLLCSTQRAAFGSRETRILQDIGEQVAVAMQWAKLREQERRRKAEMSILNEVGREAMSTLNLKTLLKSAAESIQRNVTFYDVSILLSDWDKGEMEMAAHAGAVQSRPPEGWRVKLGSSLASKVLQTGEVVLANDLARQPAGALDFPGAQPVGSLLCLPIKTAKRVDGVLSIQCKEVNAFDDSSVSALATLCDLLARAVENARLYQRTCTLRELNENIIAAMPSALLMLDKAFNVVLANSAYCKLTDSQKRDVEGRNIRQLWDEDFLKESGLLSRITEVLQTGRSSELKNIRHNRGGQQMVLNFGIGSIKAGEQPRILLIMEDVSGTVERAFQLSMLREINQAIQGTLELDKILRLVLTCVTAGHALGFNRGFLLMVDKKNRRMEGTTGIGPINLEDARNIYSDEALRRKSLKQLLNECDFSVRKEDLPLYKLARKMLFSLSEDSEIIVKTVKEKKTFLVLDAANDSRVSKRFRDLVGSNSFVSVPLVAKDEVIGVILADNLYSGHPITEDRAELLAIFANHAGLAIENGESYSRLQEEIKERIEAYQRLEEMKEREVRTSQLAAVGEMAARVAHEIRNPLVTIGGYARAILKSLPADDPRLQKSEVIVGEVMRLEKILTGVVDFSRPATPNKVYLSIDSIVDEVTEFVRPQLANRNIQLVRLQHSPLPEISADPSQIRQALFNIVKNAMEAIDSDGRIVISTEFDGEMIALDVIDSGPGIMDDVRANMFNLFYTTKLGGTGLGLAITRKIIEDHHGFLNIESTLGEGTTFSVYLPVNSKNEDAPPFQAPMQGGPQP